MADIPGDARELTPLYYALNQNRYERQQLIRSYEDAYDCRLAVIVDAILPYSVMYFEELLHDAEPGKDLHVLLASPGGDGETAVRLVRAAQARCRELVVLVPDQAKSAATLLALGAHHIMMSSTSDLGPVDPQLEMRDRELVAAKDIIEAAERATKAVESAPDTFAVWSALLADLTAVMVQQAYAAVGRSGELLREALASNPTRSPEEVETLALALEQRLITGARSHSAVFGVNEAVELKLPILAMDPSDPQWRTVWQLYTRYFTIAGRARIYESRRASQIFPVD